MKIYITGIAGFIGFHLAKALHSRSIEVSGCDTFNNYYSVELKKSRATQLKALGISIADGTVGDLSGFTHVVHLAAQAGVRHSLNHPESYAENNLSGFVDLLEACRRAMPIKLVYASSSSVYGLNTKTPFAESDPVDTPANLYAATKRANELMAFSYHHLYQIPTTGLRFFTVYGPWGRPDMAYFSFAKSILEEKPIRLFNNGEMLRDFTYIDDIIQGIIHAIDLGAPNEIFNLGNNRPEKITDLIMYLEQGLGKKAIIESLPMQPGEIHTTLADISKSQKILGYSPTTSLEEGIARFTKWIKSEAITP